MKFENTQSSLTTTETAIYSTRKIMSLTTSQLEEGIFNLSLLSNCGIPTLEPYAGTFYLRADYQGAPISFDYQQLTPRKIGSLILPMLELKIFFHGHTEEAIERFIERFHLKFLRMGE